MMLPRLKLLRELLTEDGAIFVSLDDNEVHHLRALMDEVFGQENFVANLFGNQRTRLAITPPASRRLTITSSCIDALIALS